MRTSFFVPLTFVVLAGIVPRPVGAQQVEASSVDAPSLLILQMADGRFFHPPTGTLGASAAEVRRLVLGESAEEVQEDEVPTLPQAPVDGLVRAMERARTHIQQMIANDPQGAVSASFRQTPEWRSVVAAVWNTVTDEIEYVAFEHSGTKIRGNASNLPLALIRSNGVNSEIVVSGSETHRVIALRYPILEAVPGASGTFRFRDVAYTPYSRAVHTPATIAEGEAYLDALVSAVLAQLRTDGIRSRAFPDRLLADVVDPAMMKSIAAIEHSDEYALERSPTSTLERFFVILGTNKGDSFNYARSSAGALGLVQFIPSTYRALAARSEWNLQQSFDDAMRNHQNAMRAQAIYIDTLLLEFPKTLRDTYLEDPIKAGEYIVAAYNGGSGRVRRAVSVSWEKILSGEKTRELESLRKKYTKAFDLAESLRQQTLKEKNKTKRAALQKKLDAQRVVYRGLLAEVQKLEAAILRKETIGYVEKYRLTKADDRFLHRPSALDVLVQPAAFQP